LWRLDAEARPQVKSGQLADGADEDAGANVGEVVVGAGGMVDAVAAAAGGAPLQAAQLGGEPGVVGKVGAAAVQDG
jgi:hypothetical protein